MIYYEEVPVLLPIKNGWAAHGRGWAVHGKTREEALQKYREAEAKHAEIDARPFFYERHAMKSAVGSQYHA